MANNKPISDNVAFPNQSNVRAIAGLAGYITGTPNTNVKIGGIDLVQSVINGTTAASGGLAVYATSGTVKELATYISLNYTAGDTTAPAVLELGTPSHPSTVQISGNYNGPDAFVSPKLTFLTKNTTTGSNTVSIEPSGVATADQSLIIPPAPGVANQALRAGTVGSGGNVILEWYTPTDDNTTYSLATTADTNDGKVTLTPSTGTAETITFTGANGVVVSSDASNNVTVTGPTPQTLPEPGGAAGNVQFNSNPAGTFEGEASFFFNKTGTDSSLSVGDVGADRGIFNVYGGPSNSGTISITDPNDEGLTLTVPNSMSASYTLTFPEANPTNNTMILQSDSSGDLSWIDTPASSGSIDFSGLNIATIKADLTNTTQTQYGNAVTVTAAGNINNGEIVIWDYSNGTVRANVPGSLPSQSEIIGVAIERIVSGNTGKILIYGYATINGSYSTGGSFLNENNTVNFPSSTSGTTTTTVLPTTPNDYITLFDAGGTGGGDAGNSQVSSARFDAGAGNTVKMKIIDFDFEDNTGGLRDRLQILVGATETTLETAELSPGITGASGLAGNNGWIQYTNFFGSSTAYIDGPYTPSVGNVFPRLPGESSGGQTGPAVGDEIDLGQRWAQFDFKSDSSVQSDFELQLTAAGGSTVTDTTPGAGIYLDGTSFKTATNNDSTNRYIGAAAGGSFASSSFVIFVAPPRV